MAKQESIPFLTPWLVARFPKISKPDTKGQYADGKFKTDAVPVEEKDLAVIEAALKDAAKQFFPKVSVDDVSLPIMDFFASKEAKEKGEIEARGIRLKSKYRPAVFDAKKQKLPEGVTIGGGSIIRIASALFPWHKKTKVKKQEVEEWGIGMRLGDVQVRKLVQSQAQGDGSAFDEDEEGFVYEGGDQGAEQFGDATDL